MINQIREEVERYTFPVIEEVQSIALTTFNEINQIPTRLEEAATSTLNELPLKLEEAQKKMEKLNLQNELKDFIISPPDTVHHKSQGAS